MKFWDAPFHSPAASLALDEALLDSVEAGGDEVLTCWEAPEYFVVLGFSNVAAREANLPLCARDRIPVLRRCSGGGAVLQGPGCLNYSLALRVDGPHNTQNIPSANRSVMERQRAALQSVLGRPVTVDGTSDLCVDGRKFSGNSQRRLRNALVFHGTFLLDFDLPRIGQYLATPSREPHYRQGRNHLDFVTNLHCAAAPIKAALRAAWSASEPLATPPDTQRLVAEKYQTDAWNLKY